MGGECHVHLKETDKLGMKERKVGGKRGKEYVEQRRRESKEKVTL
jgi:hypothetical protein